MHVSLFTREWIEMFIPLPCNFVEGSPSLRGSGLKFSRQYQLAEFLQSPSLRGSGLKFSGNHVCILSSSLPLYEGVDWNCPLVKSKPLIQRLPLYEGVDWNLSGKYDCFIPLESLPLYEGVDWNTFRHRLPPDLTRLPLYEGVDWNNRSKPHVRTENRLPLYEGVDWNRQPLFHLLNRVVSLFTREWIEISM